jgi:hypothetical protein
MGLAIGDETLPELRRHGDAVCAMELGYLTDYFPAVVSTTSTKVPCDA